MQSKAGTIAAYIKELPEPRRKVMSALVALCRKVLVDFDEGMEYGMPYFTRDALAVGVASQKNYISLYGLRKQAAESGEPLVGGRVGKGCITFAKPEQIDLKVIERLLVAKRHAD